MTTDTALALLAEAKEDCEELLERMKSEGWHRPERIEHQEQLIDRITALLDSGIKDAGDDVVEPMSEMWLAGNRLPQGLKLYPQKVIDSLQSALQVAQEERDAVTKKFAARWNECERMRERAEKAEAERDEFRKDAERYRYFKQHLCEPHAIAHFVKFNNWHPSDAEYLRDLDAAIDSARNK